MTDENELAKEFTHALQLLIDMPCWSFYAGESTGSDIHLDFGKKIPRTIPLLNPHLTDDQRYYDGEIALYVTCAWRLDAEGEVICGSTDSAAEDGPMLIGISSILGRVVKSVEIERPAFDLAVRFNGDLVLKIFCDQTNMENDYDDNYSLHGREKIYIVGARGHLRCEILSHRPARTWPVQPD